MNKKTASGKFVVRVPPDLHLELKRVALDQGASLNQVCVDRLKQPATGAKGLLVDTLQEFVGDGLVAIVQYGSSVRGEATEASDIDILCVIDDSVNIQRQLYRKWDELSEKRQLSKKYAVHFTHPLVDDLNASTLWLETAVEGMILFDPSLLAQRIFVKLRHLIFDQKYRRSLVHGQPVWVYNSGEGHA